MRTVLHLIAGRCDTERSNALKCVHAIEVNSPMVNQRFERVISSALDDTGAGWTDEESALMRSYWSTGEVKMRGIRLSDADWARAAEIGGGNATDGIRAALREWHK